ncbi:MAG: hypothetical protein R3250_06815, partial [Melioribacteraceae bacterium]|nr:hypothetical protein [Melioribacteraceae bacterium]
RLKEFISETDKLMSIKGFKKIASDPLTYFTEGVNVPLPQITSVITQVKAITIFSQSVSKIYVGNNLRTM